MRRLFWLAMGVTIGALVVRRLSAAAQRLTPAGIGGSIAEGLRDLADAIGDFGADVRAADAKGRTALHLAARSSFPGAAGYVRVLAAAGADLEARSAANAALPLHAAASVAARAATSARAAGRAGARRARRA